jgi:hypothetical protein
MDLTALLLVAGFFALSSGLIRLCEHLQAGRKTS